MNEMITEEKTINNKFKEIGHYLIWMGLYLRTVSEKELEERTNIKQNMLNILMQTYLYLEQYNAIMQQEKMFEDKTEEKTNKNCNENCYLSRKQVLEMYHPLFTTYGLNQAIHTNGFPYIKRGNKYFFKKSEIDKWLKENGDNRGNKRIKFV